MRTAATSWENKETVVYRSTKCLGQMLSLVLKQLKISDPFGHGGFTQETPQLVLSLLSDMLNLTWMPTLLRNHSGADIRRFKHPLRRPNSGSSSNSSISCGGGGGGCLGHCTAPSPVSSQHNGPNGPSNG
ncbi:unnamed protein product, partial [Hymenolepis diminuta]